MNCNSASHQEERGSYPFLGLAQHVHGSAVDVSLQLVFGLLESLQSLASFFRTVLLEVVRGVGLAEETALG